MTQAFAIRALASLLALLTGVALAQVLPPRTYYFVTSDPSPFQRAISPVYQSRLKTFDKDRILEAYRAHLRRSVGKDWFKYAHHAALHGPFASEEAALLQYRQQRSDLGGQVVAPRELAGFRYFEESAVLVMLEPAESGSAGEPAASTASGRLDLDIVRPALRGLPLMAYWPQEWRWDPVTDTSSLAAGVQELRPTVVMVWVDARVALNETPDTSRLREALTQALRRKLPVVVALPGRSAAELPPAVRDLQAEVVRQGGRLEWVADGAVGMTRTLQVRLRDVLSLNVLPLKINELMANNRSAVRGPDGNFSDWIEIFNPGSVPIDLAGMYLSDKRVGKSMRRIGSSDQRKTTVPAGGYRVLWLDGLDNLGPDHVSVKLSSKGEQIVLIDIDGVLVIDEVEFGAQPIDKAYARVPDGGANWSAGQAPTPGKANLPRR